MYKIIFLALLLLKIVFVYSTVVVKYVEINPTEIYVNPIRLTTNYINIEYYGTTTATTATLRIKTQVDNLLVLEKTISISSGSPNQQLESFQSSTLFPQYELLENLLTTGDNTNPGGPVTNLYYYSNVAINPYNISYNNYQPPFIMDVIVDGQTLFSKDITPVGDSNFVKYTNQGFSVAEYSTNVSPITSSGLLSCYLRFVVKVDKVDNDFLHSYEFSLPSSTNSTAHGVYIGEENSKLLFFVEFLNIQSFVDVGVVARNIYSNKTKDFSLPTLPVCQEDLTFNNLNSTDYHFGRNMVQFKSKVPVEKASLIVDSQKIYFKPTTILGVDEYFNYFQLPNPIVGTSIVVTLGMLFNNQQISTAFLSGGNYQPPSIAYTGIIGVVPNTFVNIPSAIVEFNNTVLLNVSITYTGTPLPDDKLVSLTFIANNFQLLHTEREIYDNKFYGFIMITLPSPSITLSVYGNFVDKTSVLIVSSLQIGVGVSQDQWSTGPARSFSRATSNAYYINGPDFSGMNFYPSKSMVIPTFDFSLQVDSPSTGKVVLKNYNYNFPYRYRGSAINLGVSPLIPLPFNSSSMNVFFTFNEFIDEIPIDGGGLYLDTFAPLLNGTFTFSEAGTTTDSADFYLIDATGVNSSSCFVTWANQVLHVNNENLLSGNNRNGSYHFNFQLNRYFCYLPFQVSCCDILNNCVNYDSFNQQLQQNSIHIISSTACDNNDIKLLFIDYYIVSRNQTSTQVTFSVGIHTSLQKNIIMTLIFYDNRDNIGSPVATLLLIRDNSLNYEQTIFFSKTIDIESKTNTQTLYFNLRYQVPSGILSILATKDLEYISSNINSETFPTSIQIRNFAFNGFKFFTSDIIATQNAGLVTISIDYLQMLKNITFVVKVEKLAGNKIKYSYNSENVQSTFIILSSTSFLFNLTSIYSSGYVYIEQFCDYNENCLNTGPLQIISFVNLLPTQNNQHSIKSFTSSKKVVDTSSADRLVLFSVGISSTVDIDFNVSPILYISELYTNEMLNCSLTFKSKSLDGTIINTVVEGSIFFPLNWGLNGIGDISIWNILMGSSINGSSIYNYDFIVKGSTQLKPVVGSLLFYFDSKQLVISGSNLGLLSFDQYVPIIFNTRQNFLSIQETKAVIDLSSYIIIQSFTVTIGGTLYRVDDFLHVCLKPDCSGFGQCVNGTCQCRPGRSGDDCSIDNTFKCPNDCNQHGFCADMVCNCFKDYKGPSCETYAPDQNIDMKVVTNPTQPTVSFDKFIPVVNNTQSSVNDYTKQTSFDVKISQLDELNLNSQVLNSINLTSLTWTIVDQSDNIVTYQVPLFTNSSCKMIVKIDTTKDARNLNWAGQNLTIPENSIKYTIRIENYPFTSSLNKLQLYWDALPLSNKSCGEMKTLVSNVTWGAPVSTDMHWVVLPMNQLQLYGRFSNYFIADSRIMSSSNEGLEFKEKIQVKVNIPYFKQFVELDPDFSVLVSYDQKSSQHENTDECNIDTESNTSKPKKKYVLPLIIVGSVIGATIIGVGVFVILKKNMALRLKFLKFRQSRSNSTKMKNFN